jgi:hypothetical protein
MIVQAKHSPKPPLKIGRQRVPARAGGVAVRRRWLQEWPVQAPSNARTHRVVPVAVAGECYSRAALSMVFFLLGLRDFRTGALHDGEVDVFEASSAVSSVPDSSSPASSRTADSNPMETPSAVTCQVVLLSAPSADPPKSPQIRPTEAPEALAGNTVVLAPEHMTRAACHKVAHRPHGVPQRTARRNCLIVEANP